MYRAYLRTQICTVHTYVLRITKQNKALREDETRALNKLRTGTLQPPHTLKGKIKSNHVLGWIEWQILPDKGSPSIRKKR